MEVGVVARGGSGVTGAREAVVTLEALVGRAALGVTWDLAAWGWA